MANIHLTYRQLATKGLRVLVSVLAGMLGATSEIMFDTAHFADFPHSDHNEVLITMSLTAMCILLVGFVLWYCFMHLKALGKAVGRKRRPYQAPALVNNVVIAAFGSRAPPAFQA